MITSSDVQFLATHIFGFQLNWALQGILTAQVYFYYSASFKDNNWVKTAVYGNYILELIQTGFAAHDSYIYFARDWGDVNIIRTPNINWVCFVSLAAIVASITQLFYAWRIYVLSRSKCLLIAVASLSALQLVSGIAAGVLDKVYDEYTSLLESYRALVAMTETWLALSAACDILILIVMVYFLYTHRSSSEKTMRLVNRVIKIIVETNLLTASVSIAFIVLYRFYLETGHAFVAVGFVLPKLYSNSLLAILNNRSLAKSGHSICETTVADLTTSRGSEIHFRRGRRDMCATDFETGNVSIGTRVDTGGHSPSVVEVALHARDKEMDESRPVTMYW
ncbi:hypothetical protein CONPUDRAFT_163867 [Coniophora puteana RWD-64-598 SS2]|uniref:DUF6534 domain-containing protein n=1 Tax=Coniophora puteana (strain RWD-64-598) TaxID=741705 RepID=A0A5M3MVQ4_CONPW|nr:uncharacterized protein CONPUDRAFT_163867 [Coniophora puteana RWD-64-598 SS2]EIW82795.1 hypothetical protein CONPUDRAFT_163867 [Coniophora puteana RWD-64-598 SS2]